MAETKTPNYDLVKPDPQDFYDVLKFNGNADKIDAALKALADAIGGIDLTTLSQAIANVQNDLTEHKSEEASTTKRGHVQLNDTRTSTSTTQAATARVVKSISDELATAGASINNQISTLNNNLNAHLAAGMPHQFTDGTATYRYGFKTNATKDGLIFVYEEVV